VCQARHGVKGIWGVGLLYSPSAIKTEAAIVILTTEDVVYCMFFVKKFHTAPDWLTICTQERPHNDVTEYAELD
jgi:hypothetical protein